jgi:hypothetical protein
MVDMPQIFPKWSNTAAKWVPILLVVKGCLLVFVVWYWFSPKNLDVGYQPVQPIPFSHKQHADDLGINCQYCHYQVTKSTHAGVPGTEICLNCHLNLANKNLLSLSPLMRSAENNTPIPWVRIHETPDFAYFPHAPHIAAGVGCQTCHGNINEMKVVKQEKPLSMAWCLECHRNPAPNLRPPSEVTNMNYHQTDAYKAMAAERAKLLNPPILGCSGCHR